MDLHTKLALERNLNYTTYLYHFEATSLTPFWVSQIVREKTKVKVICYSRVGNDFDQKIKRETQEKAIDVVVPSLADSLNKGALFIICIYMRGMMPFYLSSRQPPSGLSDF